MYGNMGYMGLPLSKAVLDAITGNGDIGVFYCSIACAIFNIFAFTHGVTVMSKTKEKFDIKKLIVNPGALGVLIGLPLFLLKVPLPSVIATPISSIGAMNTPLAMIMLGTYLANANLKDAFSHKNIYIASFTKLILMPALLILGFYVCGVRGDLLITASVFVSAPSATNTAMFAAKYDRDTSVASQVSGFTTLLCTFTMPVFVAIGGILVASRGSSAQVMCCDNYLMQALAAVFVGRSVGGAEKPNARGTLIGAMLVSTLENGLTICAVPFSVLPAVKGAVLALALVAAYATKKEQ